MAPPTPETDATIESLLEQRAQYEQWIHRLDAAGEKAPPAVRQKVRADYEGRLQGVIQQLRGHAATINAELERHQSTQGELDRERRSAEEALSEAEVRYAVGEFSDEEWTRISEQAQQGLERLRSELRTVGDEIARLAEVQQLIGAARRPPPPAPAAAPAAVTPAPAAHSAPAPAAAITHQVYESESPAAAPVAQTAASPSTAPVQAAPPPPAPANPAAGVNAFDEMTFLKSVSEEERPSAPARRPSNPGSGGQGRPEAATPSGGGTSSASTATAASPPPSSAPAGQGKSGASGVAKTLKCGECGTLNRPTEWYCERCGAELAAL